MNALLIGGPFDGQTRETPAGTKELLLPAVFEGPPIHRENACRQCGDEVVAIYRRTDPESTSFFFCQIT